MKKKFGNLAFFFIFLLNGLFTFSQVPLNEDWFITRNGLQNLADFAWGVDIDASGNIYWATTQSVTGVDIKNLYTYKIDPNGNEIWPSPHILSKPNEQQSYHSVLENDILYVGGRTFSSAFGLANSDAFLMALDVNTTDTLWTYTWDRGYGYEEIDGIVIRDNAIYISGWSAGDTTNQDAFISKLDLNGNLQWTTIWGSDGYDQCDGHCIVDDSTIYISGLYDLSTAAGQAYVAGFNKFTGAYKWHSFWGGLGIEDGLGLNSQGDYLYQCGTTSSHGDSSVFVNKYDKSGNLIWSKLTNKAIKARSLDFDAEGNLYLAATSSSSGTDEDLIIMKRSTSTGDLVEYRTWGGDLKESVQDIKIKDEFMYLTGRTVSYSVNNSDDAFLIKAPLFSPTIDVNEITRHTIEVYPNPTKNELYIRSQTNTNIGLLNIYDVRGICVYSNEFSTQNEVTIRTIKWNTGIYYVSLNGVVIQRVMKD